MKGKAVLHGIVSWGTGCGDATPFPGNSANVFKLMSFVKDVLVRTFEQNQTCLSLILLPIDIQIDKEKWMFLRLRMQG